MTRPITVVELAVGCERLNFMRWASRELSRMAGEHMSVLFTIHEHQEPAVRLLPNFIPVEKYAQQQPLVANEIGICEMYRFAIIPMLDIAERVTP